ncbi:hypothetical protein ES703_94843 [subsurface metagenome]
MNITGIEVIRRNPGMAIVPNPGVVIGVVAGEKIELTYDETLRVNVSFDYRGPAMETTLEGAIGKLHGFPTPWLEVLLKKGATIDLPDSPDVTPCSRSVDIPITSDIDPGTDYDLSVSLLDYREAGHPTETDVIDIVGIPPTYELIQDTIYHFAYIYDGDVEVTTATFKIDPFTPSAWAAQKFADALESEARKKGARVLEVKVYVDTTPLLWTDIRIEITGTPLGETVEAAAGIAAIHIPVWLAIILVCLAIIALIVVATLMWERFQRTFKHKPGLEDVKPAWGKEALILDIQDAEAYWERTPTPVETLEGMSEEELRDKLDQIAEEEVPPEEVPWAVLAIVGGLGILGVGAAVALAARRE